MVRSVLCFVPLLHFLLLASLLLLLVLLLLFFHHHHHHLPLAYRRLSRFLRDTAAAVAAAVACGASCSRGFQHLNDVESVIRFVIR